MYISPTERPERMFRRGRPEIAYFAPDELLFRRYRTQDQVGGVILPAALQFPRQSVNRGSLSEPEDLLFAESGMFNGWGVFEFRNEDLPAMLSVPGASVIRFFMKHVPEEDNYAHSEIWCSGEGAPSEYMEPPSSLKKLFRAILQQKIKIRIHAGG